MCYDRRRESGSAGAGFLFAGLAVLAGVIGRGEAVRPVRGQKQAQQDGNQRQVIVLSPAGSTAAQVGPHRSRLGRRKAAQQVGPEQHLHMTVPS